MVPRRSFEKTKSLRSRFGVRSRLNLSILNQSIRQRVLRRQPRKSANITLRTMECSSPAGKTSEAVEPVRVILCNNTAPLVEAWKKVFGIDSKDQDPRFPVEFFCGSFRDYGGSFDCIVSPANSFGLMDGGIDMAISRFFGGVEVLIPKVQRALVDRWGGQQPVGTCSIIATGGVPNNPETCPFLAHSPTMIIPTVLAPDTTVPYQCFRSILNEIALHNRQHAAFLALPDDTARETVASFLSLSGMAIPSARISSVLCTGLGTGVGGVSPGRAAEQMHLAYSHFLGSLGLRNKERVGEEGQQDGNEGPGRRLVYSDFALVTWDHALEVGGDVEKLGKVEKEGGKDRKGLFGGIFS